MIEFETDSRKVKPGQTFVAIKGYTVDGHDYIDSAIKNGATKIIAERNVDCSVPVEVVKDTKLYLNEELVKKYSKDFENLKIIGITGTNGKTTTAYLLYQFLNKLGNKTAYIGTIGFYYEDYMKELPNTTPDILSLYNLLYEAMEHNCTTVVMEVSSHSLEEKRIEGIRFDRAAFTNLTQDHLDFHKTMENYLNAKLKILNYLKPDGVLVLNNDDNYAHNFMDNSFEKITIGFSDGASIKVENVDYSITNTKIDFIENKEKYSVETNLLSKFNVYNYLTCYAILKSLKYSFEDIKKVTKVVYPPKGRCEIIRVNNGIAVVDYAHTPDAVEKIISTFDELEKNRIITIIGCGGDRDPVKRPIMGKMACKLSDYVIFTNDNPRTEDPKKIMDDIVRNIGYTNYEIVFDRKEAIFKGLNMIDDNDILLVLGKGHENYQIIGREKVHFDDCETIKSWKDEN